ncbi:MAG: glycosyltransferase family 9 protein [Sphingobacteriales bacterium]|nr:MAG: glycosyltransferase family 9 protein [Sphingobacteriales bacterium]
MKILIRLPNWLGDVVMSTAFVAAVRQLYADAEIDVIIKKELGGIASFIPGINTIHLFSKQEYASLAGAYSFGKTLRPLQYDIFFNLPGSISSATLGWATKARKRIGFGREGSFFLLTKVCRRPKNVHRVTEYISMLEQFAGITIPDTGVHMQTASHDKDDKRVIINFNSEAVSRRMPVSKGVELLTLLTHTFPAITFALVGGPKDSEYVESVLSSISNRANLQNYCGKTDLPGLASLMAGSVAILTTDSGPAHLANSVGLPVVVLFGAGNEHNTAPYNKQDLTVLRANQLICEPCVRNTCKLYGIPKCMELLDETKIINALSPYI